MKLKFIFTLGLAVIALPGLAISIWNASQAREDGASARSLTLAAAAMGRVMAAAEIVAVQRGLIVAASVSAADPTAALAQAATSEHTAAEDSILVPRAANQLVEPLQSATARMRALREAVCQASKLPAPARDPALSGRILGEVGAALQARTKTAAGQIRTMAAEVETVSAIAMSVADDVHRQRSTKADITESVAEAADAARVGSHSASVVGGAPNTTKRQSDGMLSATSAMQSDIGTRDSILIRFLTDIQAA